PSTGPGRCCCSASSRSTPPSPPARPTSCSSTRATSPRPRRSSNRTPRSAASPPPGRPAPGSAMAEPGEGTEPGPEDPQDGRRDRGGEPAAAGITAGRHEARAGAGAAEAIRGRRAGVEPGAVRTRPRTLEEADQRLAEVGAGIALTELLAGFIGELRAAGLPVSLTENLDAMAALQHIPLEDRDAFKYALGATLVKNAAHWRVFETVFEVYFSVRGGEFALTDEQAEALAELEERMGEMPGQTGDRSGGGALGDDLTPQELAEMLMRALSQNNEAMLRALARQAVRRYAGMEPGRPVGGTYYLYRTLRNLDLEGVAEKLLQQAREQAPQPLTPLEERLERDEIEARIDRLRKEIEAEIRRRLVADRGVEAMARTLRKPLPEDVDFMHASRE